MGSKFKNIADIEEGWSDFKDATRGGNSKAHWVNSSGKVYDVPTTHIEFVAKKPSLFNTTVEKMEKLYDKYDEKFPKQEGKARVEIMTDIVKKGWIRTRFRPREGAWVAETWKWGSREKKALINWVKYETNGKKVQFRINFISTSKNKIIGHSYSLDMLGEQVVENVINESSLSRIWSHNEKHDCGAMTAFRNAADCGEGEKYTNKINKARNQKLLGNLLTMGYGVTKLIGKYPEGGRSSKELSFFIVDKDDNGNLLNDLKKLGKIFEQDSVLIVPKGSVNKEAKAYLLGTNSCKNNWLGMNGKEYFAGGHPGKSSKIYTSFVNGRPFMFEEVGEEVHPPGNGMGWWAMDLKSKTQDGWMNEIMKLLENE